MATKSHANGTTNPQQAAPAGSTHPLTDSVTETLHRSVDALSQRAGATETNLRDSAASSSDAISQKRQELEAQWEGSAIKRYAVENPVAAAGIAFAAGALIASLFSRK